MAEERHEVGDGVHLAPVRAADRAAYLRHFADPEIARNLLRVPHPYTEADAEWWIEHRRRHARTPETHFAIRAPDGALIGGIGLAGEAPEPVSPAEIGYWLAAEHRGRGLMPRVIRVFAHHCFARLGLAEITALPFHWNAASCRALEKAGFRCAGRLPARFRKGDETIDAWDYRLCAADLRAERAPERPPARPAAGD
jgi:RimJ/RimL family protein N-acetyltransferase